MSALLLLVLWPCVTGIFTSTCENVDVHENFSLEESEIVLRSEVPGEVYFREDSSLQGLTIDFLGRGFEVSSMMNGTFAIGFNLVTSGAPERHGLWSAACLGLAAATRESMALPLVLFCLPGAVALDCQARAWVMIRITYPPGFPTDGITLTGDLVIGAEDPAPKRTEPGTYRCDACPALTTVILEPLDRWACHQGCEPSTDPEVETDAATMRFQGMVSGAGDGYWYVARTDGSRQGTAGDVRPVTWWNFSGALVLVYRVRTTGCALDFLFHLDWDAELRGHRDLDLHLLKAPGCWMRDTFWHNMVPAWGGKLRFGSVDSVKLVTTMDGTTGEVDVSDRDYELTLSTFCPGMDLWETLEVLLENTTVDILPDQPNCLMYCGALTLQKRLQTFLVSSSD
ncbi:unnamed protein product, partial [Symbiodinium microadriaticum]